MRKLQNEQSLREDRTSRFVVLVLCIIVAILSIGRVFMANRLVEVSDKLRKMDREVNQLEVQNQDLTQELRAKESISNLEVKAVEMGFEPTRKFVYLTPPAEVAYLR